ncbi:hypothetical protein RZO85_28220, partial [Raoultella ornithinolytica]|uniref:hypothetical protein n=1 Tax=Raoultella ornithinolytica TaxID=54291 RepID=UPI00292B30D3
AIDQIAQSGLSSLSVIYYSAHLFSKNSDSSENTNAKNRIGEMRNGNSGYGYYVNSMKADTDDE